MNSFLLLCFSRTSNRLALGFLLVAGLAGCAPKQYVQIVQAQSDQAKVEQGFWVFENEDCRVSYQIWGPGGDIGFVFYNKTDHDLTLHLDHTFLVVNGWSTAYFQNRTFGKSQSQFATTSLSFNNLEFPVTDAFGRAQSEGVQYIERPLVVVPARTQIRLSEFRILKAPLVHPELRPYPKKKHLKTATFSPDNSPLHFSNRITYSGPADTLRFENSFYASALSNYPAQKWIRLSDSTQLHFPDDPQLIDFKPHQPRAFYVPYFKR
jgi:hypothetical protein